ncbi:MAG: universal stress protein [Planctomycetota bacterium]|jgi:nucleotide-binding universal stress UspA family protein
MIQIDKILFPTDFSRCADQALSHALFLAERYEATLYMLHAIVLHEEDPHNPAKHFPDVDALYDILKKLAHTDMNGCLEAHDPGKVKIEMEHVRGFSTPDVIVDYATDNDIDLIVMGTHGRRGLGHVFLGSVAEEVVRLAPCPVITVREQEKPRPVQSRDRILVLLDFSEHSEDVLEAAREVAARYGAKLDLLHVIEEQVHPAFYGTGKTTILEMRPDIVDRTRKALQKLVDEGSGPKVDTELHAVIGHAAREIIRFSEENSTDLIVIATHGLSGIRRWLIGSVAERVVRMASCPVLTVKAFGKSLIVR